jgi:hypothetical protein
VKGERALFQKLLSRFRCYRLCASRWTTRPRVRFEPPEPTRRCQFAGHDFPAVPDDLICAGCHSLPTRVTPIACYRPRIQARFIFSEWPNSDHDGTAPLSSLQLKCAVEGSGDPSFCATSVPADCHQFFEPRMIVVLLDTIGSAPLHRKSHKLSSRITFSDNEPMSVTTCGCDDAVACSQIQSAAHPRSCADVRNRICTPPDKL